MRIRHLVGGAVTTALVGATLVAGGPVTGAGAATSAPVDAGRTTAPTDYVVLYERGASDAAARAAIADAGGTVTTSNAKVGYAVARSSAGDFSTRATASDVLVGAARNRSIGTAPDAQRPARTDVERQEAARTAARTERGAASVRAKAKAKNLKAGAEPLADLQWDMRAIGATAQGTHKTQPGSKKVLVGVIDTGIDGSHPDIAPNFDAADSRNFTRDMVDIDGPCEVTSCIDPADVDEDGHGTHVASTIGSPVNGLGVAGVAPDVTLVNIRAGQDSGYFFLQPTLDALTYAGDLGVDVVNMSFYVDPWLYNCTANPADSPAEQAEQRTIREATQRALDYARGKGVLPIAAAGNGATDLGKPTRDATSPDYPVGTERDRAIDNSCITVPTESAGVVAVTSTGISSRKAYYSDYGIEQADVAAPGGDTYDTPNGRQDPKGAVLAAYPATLAVLNGDVDAAGNPTTPFVLKDCSGRVCGYYQYLQGTSMAAPHAAGVAALIVSEYGVRDPAHRGTLTLAPGRTEGLLTGTATDTACPTPATYTYRRVLASGAIRTSTATCEGTKDRNGFYGEGIISATAAVG